MHNEPWYLVHLYKSLEWLYPHTIWDVMYHNEKYWPRPCTFRVGVAALRYISIHNGPTSMYIDSESWHQLSIDGFFDLAHTIYLRATSGKQLWTRQQMEGHKQLREILSSGHYNRSGGTYI